MGQIIAKHALTGDHHLDIAAPGLSLRPGQNGGQQIRPLLMHQSRRKQYRRGFRSTWAQVGVGAGIDTAL
jgi:hypothetical protein